MTADELAEAVVEVWAAVLDRDDLTTTDDLVAWSADQATVIDAVSLTNQLLGAGLTVLEVLEHRTAKRVADTLRSRGVREPGRVPPPVGTTRGGGIVVERSRRMWNTTYRFADPRRDGDFDTAGWFQTHVPVPMADEQMREWLDTTVARLELLSPRGVLDIGCGSGMVLMRLARACEHYVGVDLAEEAVARLRTRTRADPAFAHVDVAVADARHAAAVVVAGPYDLVLLNSVIQYFPGRRYLAETLESVGSVLAPRGSVFLGDVHNHDLTFAERLVALAGGAPGGTSAVRIREEVARSVADGTELGLSVGDLDGLVTAWRPDGAVRVLVRRGRHPTTMNRFRYDALLSTGPLPGRVPDGELRWSPRSGVPALEALTRLPEKADTVVVRSVPDARTVEWVRLADELRDAPVGATLADCRARVHGADAVDPDELWAWGDERGVGVAVAPGATPGLVDVALWRGRDEWAASTLLRPVAATSESASDSPNPWRVPQSRDRSCPAESS